MSTARYARYADYPQEYHELSKNSRVLGKIRTYNGGGSGNYYRSLQSCRFEGRGLLYKQERYKEFPLDFLNSSALAFRRDLTEEKNDSLSIRVRTNQKGGSERWGSSGDLDLDNYRTHTFISLVVYRLVHAPVTPKASRESWVRLPARELHVNLFTYWFFQCFHKGQPNTRPFIPGGGEAEAYQHVFLHTTEEIKQKLVFKGIFSLVAILWEMNKRPFKAF